MTALIKILIRPGASHAKATFSDHITSRGTQSVPDMAAAMVRPFPQAAKDVGRNQEFPLRG